MRFVTSDPRTAGLAGRVYDSVMYVDTGSGEATELWRFGPADTDWIAALSDGEAEPVTADPRSAGLARPVGSRALYIPASGPAVMLYKYAATDTAWCTRAQPAPSGGVSSGSGPGFGTATVDFGATHTQTSSVTVSGLTGLTSSGFIQAWIRPATTTQFNEYEHTYVLPLVVKLTAAPGSGSAVIYATADFPIKGEVGVAYSWRA